jgi:hypothetical protein
MGQKMVYSMGAVRALLMGQLTAEKTVYLKDGPKVLPTVYLMVDY